MKIFRLSRRPYAYTLSGVGASRYGYRWNSKGTEIIYCAESRALAMAEVMVHLTAATVPDDLCMIEIAADKEVSVQLVSVEELPDGWNAFPHSFATQAIGDDFVRRGEACLLRVPSAVVAGDWNYLINPAHAHFRHIKIHEVIPFKIDQRLMVGALS